MILITYSLEEDELLLESRPWTTPAARGQAAAANTLSVCGVVKYRVPVRSSVGFLYDGTSRSECRVITHNMSSSLNSKEHSPFSLTCAAIERNEKDFQSVCRLHC